MVKNVAKMEYIIVDTKKLQKDVIEYCRSNGLVMTRQLVINGLCDSVFSNMRTNWEKHKDIEAKKYDVTNITVVGRLREDFYESILNIFKLKDIYRAPNNKIPVVEEEKATNTNNDEILAKLDEILVTLNKLVDLWTPTTSKPTPVKPVATLRS